MSEKISSFSNFSVPTRAGAASSAAADEDEEEAAAPPNSRFLFFFIFLGFLFFRAVCHPHAKITIFSDPWVCAGSPPAREN